MILSRSVETMKKKISKDDDYPFGTGHWEKWSTSKKLSWLTNFRDQLRKNDGAMAKKLGITSVELEKLDKDVKSLEAIALYERANRN